MSIARILINNGASVSIENDVPMYLSSVNGHLDIVKFLVDTYGPSIITEPTIHFAAKYGKIDVLRFLVENLNSIFDVMCVKMIQYTIECAADYGYLETVEYIFGACGSDPTIITTKAIMAAVKEDNFDIAEFLIKNFKGYEFECENKYETIRRGIWKEQFDFVKFVVENYVVGWEINFILCFASEGPNLDIVRYLVDKGADIHFENETPLLRAIEYHNLSIVKYLVDCGADLKKFSDNFLERISMYGNSDIIQYLVELGVDFTTSGKCLGSACRNNRLITVKIFIENGVDVQTNDNYAIKCASERGYINLVKLLIENGADVTADDNYAIKAAILNNHLDVVELLHSNGATALEKL